MKTGLTIQEIDPEIEKEFHSKHEVFKGTLCRSFERPAFQRHSGKER